LLGWRGSWIAAKGEGSGIEAQAATKSLGGEDVKKAKSGEKTPTEEKAAWIFQKKRKNG